MGSGLYLRRAQETYGLDNFTKEILFECSSEHEMNNKERELVNENFVKRDDTYNLKVGGDGGWDYVNSSCHNNIGNHRRTGFLKFIDNGINPFLKWYKHLSDDERRARKEKISESVKNIMRRTKIISKENITQTLPKTKFPLLHLKQVLENVILNTGLNGYTIIP